MYKELALEKLEDLNNICNHVRNLVKKEKADVVGENFVRASIEVNGVIVKYTRTSDCKMFSLENRKEIKVNKDPNSKPDCLKGEFTHMGGFFKGCISDYSISMSKGLKLTDGKNDLLGTEYEVSNGVDVLSISKDKDGLSYVVALDESEKLQEFYDRRDHLIGSLNHKSNLSPIDSQYFEAMDELDKYIEEIV
ncbi:MAG: hypothetical protein N4A47_01390 [Clostridia bacterium]|jgi:hypothetical protein|nr:hypothetical protein [Clostridia bacterium]